MNLCLEKNVISSKGLIIVTLTHIDQERIKVGSQPKFPKIPEFYKNKEGRKANF